MQAKNSKHIFRQDKNTQNLSTYQLDHLVKIVPSYSWLTLVAIYTAVAMFIAWSLFGSIPSYVEGRGIILAGEGSLYNAVVPEGAVKVKEMQINLGEEVKEGQLLAQLEAPKLTELLNEKKNHLHHIQHQLKNLEHDYQIQIKKRVTEIEKRKEILNRVIKNSQNNLVSIDELIKIQEEGLKKGVETKRSLLATFQSYYATKNKIDEAKEKLNNNNLLLTEFINKWDDRIRMIELKLSDIQQDYQETKVQLDLAQNIHSPISGIVSSIQVNIGDSVSKGMPLLTIASNSQKLIAVAFLNANEGKKVTDGMFSLITPTTIKKEEYGSIKGMVSIVSEYPASQKTLLAILQNKDLVSDLSQGSVVIVSRINLIPDNDNQSGYEWTSSKGPNHKISAGTLTDIRIKVRDQAPITLFIPAFKKILGVS